MSEGGGTPRVYLIGCDVGVTNVKTVCVTLDGTVFDRDLSDTHAENRDWPEGVKRVVARMEGAHGHALAVGVAAPGIASRAGDSIYWMRGRLDEVQGLDWGR